MGFAQRIITPISLPSRARLDFDHLLLAHGDPIFGDGKTALRDFVARHA